MKTMIKMIMIEVNVVMNILVKMVMTVAIMRMMIILKPECCLIWRRFEVVHHAVDEVEPDHGDVHVGDGDGSQ